MHTEIRIIWRSKHYENLTLKLYQSISVFLDFCLTQTYNKWPWLCPLYMPPLWTLSSLQSCSLICLCLQKEVQICEAGESVSSSGPVSQFISGIVLRQHRLRVLQDFILHYASLCHLCLENPLLEITFSVKATAGDMRSLKILVQDITVLSGLNCNVMYPVA